MLHDLYTKQGESLTGTPWEIYPRPQMKRESYVNLNGDWELEVSSYPSLPETYSHRIRVPFCPESLLSGLKMEVAPGSYLYYRKTVSLPRQFNRGRVLLHIGAADQIAEVYVNGTRMGMHIGGYNSFTVDITENWTEETELVIACFDNLQDKTLPYGKQCLKRGGMWYTPVSGIWQSVWLESVPEQYIQSLKIENRGYTVTIQTEPALEGTVIVKDLGEFPLREGKVVITPENPHLWSPENPYLYTFTVETQTDRVKSYFAVRSLDVKQIDGILRLCLNGQPYFFHGLLDQGYWPDGIYTPASPECYAEDILAMKALGFNTLRKHIKVEPEEFYYQCDKLGMIVFQDMVNNGDYSFLRDTLLPTLGMVKLPDKNLHKDSSTREQFVACMQQTVKQLGNHPSIVYWTIFNEGWGQFDSDDMYVRLKALDDTRFIDSTSGWFRRKKTDVDSRHIYFSPWSQLQPSDKPLLLSEFGGYAHPVEGHLFNTGNAYGYKTCRSLEQFQTAIEALYRQKVIPAVARGLCGAICTQVSDVEDEINGFLTYDRKICKADPEIMRKLAGDLQTAMK